MKIFKRTALLFILTSFFLLLFSSFCFAQFRGRELEIGYPSVPGVETPTTTKTILSNYLKYVFTLAIIITGLLAFISLIYGGFHYLTSTGDPNKMTDAKNQVTASFFGLILLLSSYLILNTINPQLVLPKNPLFQPAIAGVYAYVKSNCVDDAEDFTDDRVLIDEPRIPDLGQYLPQPLQCIEFLSIPGELTVEVYSEINYGGGLIYEGNEGKGTTKNVNGQSMKLDYHPPGVYLYANAGCQGDCPGSDCKIYQGTSATLPDFENRVQSIKFVYGRCDVDGECQDKYAAILHEDENFMGKAALFDQGQNICFNLSSVVSAAKRGQFSNILESPGKYYSSNPMGISVCEAAVCTETDAGPNDWDTWGECDANGDGDPDFGDYCTKLLSGDWILVEIGCDSDGDECIQTSHDCGPEQNCSYGECVSAEEPPAEEPPAEEPPAEEPPAEEPPAEEPPAEEPPAEEPPAEEVVPGEGGYGSNLSGAVSSVTIYLKPVEGETGQGVKFWGDKGFTKEKDPVELGYYINDDAVPDLGDEDADNKISSMEMKGPYVALLCDGTNYSGNCEVFMESCLDFRSYRIGQCGWLGRGDCLSSFIIKARK